MTSTPLRQLGQQTAVAWFDFTYIELLVDLPGLANSRVHNRDPKILFKELDNAHRLPATALNIDAVRIAMLTIKTLDVGVEHLDRNLRYLVERHVDRIHRKRPETGGNDIVQHNF